MLCKNCNKEISDDSISCIFCDAPVDNGSRKNVAATNSSINQNLQKSSGGNTNLKRYIPVILIGVILVVGAFGLYKYSKKRNPAPAFDETSITSSTPMVSSNSGNSNISQPISETIAPNSPVSSESNTGETFYETTTDSTAQQTAKDSETSINDDISNKNETSNFSTRMGAKVLDKKTSFAYVMKAYNYEYNNEEFLYHYLDMFDGNFNSYSENEFELKRKKENALLEIKKLIDNVNYDIVYYRDQIAFLGDYDFNNGRFEFEPFGQIFSNRFKYPYFYVFNFPSRGLNSGTETRNVSQILLKNYKDFDGLIMNSTVAETLLKQLPNNRQVYLRFYYSMLPEKFQLINNTTYDGGVFCHISLVEVWGDENMSKNNIAVLKAK